MIKQKLTITITKMISITRISLVHSYKPETRRTPTWRWLCSCTSTTDDKVEWCRPVGLVALARRPACSLV